MAGKIYQSCREKKSASQLTLDYRSRAEISPCGNSGIVSRQTDQA